VPATFKGAVTIGDCVPGLASAFNDVGTALQDLRDEVVLHLPCFLEAIAAMADVRVVAIVDFQAQLNASVQLGIQLNAALLNPLQYLEGLLAGLAQLNLNLPTLLPSFALQTQIAANLAVGAVAGAKIAAVDAKIAIVVDLLNACYAALLAVSTAAFSAIQTFQTFQALLNTSGAFALSYSGTLGALGSALDAATPASGIGTATAIVATIQFVRSVDANAVSAQSQCFLV
jgi:hypothetical protein